MNKRQWTVLLSVTIAGLAYILFTSFRDTPKLGPASPNVKTAPHLTMDAIPGEIAEHNSDKPVYIRHHNCRRYFDAKSNVEHAWRQAFPQYVFAELESYDAAKLLRAVNLMGDGLSEDKIAREYAKRHTLEVQSKQNIKNDLFNSGFFTKEELESGTLVATEEIFKKYLDSSVEERVTNREQVSRYLSVEHIVKLLRKGQASDDDAVELMSMLDDINAYTRNPNDDLLKYLIEHENIALLESYQNLGGKYASRGLRLNALELYVISTPFSRANVSVLDHITGVTKSIRISTLENSSTRSFKIGSEMQEPMYQVGEFSTFVVSSRNISGYDEYFKANGITLEHLGRDSNTDASGDIQMLFEKWSQIKHSFIQNHLLGYSDADALLCESTRAEVYDTINSAADSSVFEEAVARYGEDKEAIIEAVSHDSPWVAECIAQTNSERPKSEVVMTIKGLNYSVLEQNDVSAYVDQLQLADLNDATKSRYFWDAFNLPNISATELVDAGLSPQRESFRKAAAQTPEKFESLVSTGFAFDGPDYRGNGIVKYAAAQCNSQLVSYLFERGYEYQLNHMGIDPLAVSLMSRCRGGVSKKLNTIRGVMSYEPRVEDFHRSAMAKLKLLKWGEYQKITSEFPELSVPDSTEAVSAPLCFR